MSNINKIKKVYPKDLQALLGFNESLLITASKPVTVWRVEYVDEPIFRYIYRNFKPKRHLEFGTWQGAGTFLCLDECTATVWTINLPLGEESAGYSVNPEEYFSVSKWADYVKLDTKRTDTIGFIGRLYLEKGLGGRVCQIYSDTRDWDISNYPNDFFDTVLIDGAHTEELVINDTKKALSLLRSKGIVMWHDFCPEIEKECSNTIGIHRAIEKIYDILSNELSDIFWIYPSWILLGVKK